ncbi:MAG: hypothetical protein HY328_00120 [Chloroflexi bacterium]|nr:hypothetical protein [Chloroflexota bacterium]
MEDRPDLVGRDTDEIGPPHSALNPLCQRCRVYAALPNRQRAPYCPTCSTILNRAAGLKELSLNTVLLWGHVNLLPYNLSPLRQAQDTARAEQGRVAGAYVHSQMPGQTRFLVALHRQALKPWLQDLVLHQGMEMRGVLQLFPTTGMIGASMGDLVCHIVHHESRFPMDALRVRFFATVHQVLQPHRYDKQGVVNFEIGEFLSMLEMAAVFRTVLRPDEQQMLLELVSIESAAESQFYWGRFMGYLNPEARDMLDGWNVRNWSKPQLNLLYNLIEHVAFYHTA